jgi:VCBS repeat-containing protein
VGTQIVLDSGALLTVRADGAYDYDPDSLFEHLNTGDSVDETFTYAVSDGRGGSDTSTVTITVNGVTDGETILIFDHDDYTGDGGIGVDEILRYDEAYCLSQALLEMGHVPIRTDATTDAELGALLAGAGVLMLPEHEGDAPGYPAAAAIESFVHAGGTLVVFGYSGLAEHTLPFVNDTFGFALQKAEAPGPGLAYRYETYYRTDEAAGTRFADNPDELPWNDGTSTIQTAFLPEEAISLYESETGVASALCVMPYGAGEVVYFGWDYFIGAPVASQDNGWVELLADVVDLGSSDLFL